MNSPDRKPRRQVPAPRSMTVAGIMSGTSADGVDVALVRMNPAKGSGSDAFPRFRLLGHVAVPYPAAVRRRVLQIMNASCESIAEISRLHWRLGQIYADAVQRALERYPVKLDLVGCHGQTIYHQAVPRRFLGGDVACTWQLGEASILASRLGVPVVSDFRPADMAAGGQGAPLVPLLDYVAFRHAKRNRVLQNLGGISNVTVIPANASLQDVFAFDTGPGNMVIDAIMTECFNKPYDARGRTASRGQILEPLMRTSWQHRFFHLPPPKSAGREEFGREFTKHFLEQCRQYNGDPEDAVATATGLTALSIGLSWNAFIEPALANAPTDYIVAGGGVKNRELMEMIKAEVEGFSKNKVRIQTSDAFGIPTAAKESLAFALLAYQTWNQRPGNVPGATGAKQPVILGKIAYA